MRERCAGCCDSFRSSRASWCGGVRIVCPAHGPCCRNARGESQLATQTLQGRDHTQRGGPIAHDQVGVSRDGERKGCCGDGDGRRRDGWKLAGSWLRRRSEPESAWSIPLNVIRAPTNQPRARSVAQSSLDYCRVFSASIASGSPRSADFVYHDLANSRSPAFSARTPS